MLETEGREEKQSETERPSLPVCSHVYGAYEHAHAGAVRSELDIKRLLHHASPYTLRWGLSQSLSSLVVLV